MPVLVIGLLTCYMLEKKKWFSYGVEMPGNIRSHLLETEIQMEAKRGHLGRAKLVIQALTGVWLIVALAMHLAAVGIIGLSVIVILTSLNGVVEEHQLGQSF